MSGVRSELLAYFTHVLLGDALAAEYLILHLISNVYVSPTEPEKPQTDDSSPHAEFQSFHAATVNCSFN